MAGGGVHPGDPLTVAARTGQGGVSKGYPATNPLGAPSLECRHEVCLASAQRLTFWAPEARGAPTHLRREELQEERQPGSGWLSARGCRSSGSPGSTEEQAADQRRQNQSKPPVQTGAWICRGPQCRGAAAPVPGPLGALPAFSPVGAA